MVIKMYASVWDTARDSRDSRRPHRPWRLRSGPPNAEFKYILVYKVWTGQHEPAMRGAPCCTTAAGDTRISHSPSGCGALILMPRSAWDLFSHEEGAKEDDEEEEHRKDSYDQRAVAAGPAHRPE